MSDPLARLGSLEGPAPDLDAIKLRAHRIRRRRQTGLASAGAAAMAIIAVVGVLLATGPDGRKAERTLAGDALATAEPSPASQAYGAITVPRRAESKAKAPSELRSGGGTTSGSAGVSGGSAAQTEGESSADTALAPAAKGDSTKAELEATITVEDSQMLGRGKTFTLKVCNTTSEVVKRSFGSSKRYDFEVSRGGEVVWRWSDGQMYSQVLGEETWKAKACKEWSAEWDGSESDGGRAPAGDYKAVGVLTSQPEVRSAAKTFSLSAL